MTKRKEPVAVRIRKDPEACNLDPQVLKQVVELTNGEDASKFIQRMIRSAASDALAADHISADEKEVVGSYKEEFDFCFELVCKLSGSGKIVALGAIEAVLAIATLAPPDESRKHQIRTMTARSAATQPRPKAISDFTVFFNERLGKNLTKTNKQIKDELIYEASGWSDNFELSTDKKSIVSCSRTSDKLKISGIDQAISKARKKIREKSLPPAR